MADPGFGPVARRSVSDEVFSELRDAILTGRFAPGDLLPPERDLAASFVVNRHAVREALQRLQQASMVRVVQGGGTRVLDVRSSAGLDLLAHVARASDQPDPAIIRDGLEMRRCIGVEAARLAATRADPAARRRIVAAAADYGSAPAGAEPDRAFWLEVVEASGNLAFRLALNSLVQAIDARPGVMDPLLRDDRADTLPHAVLAQAIVERDADRAAAEAERILTQALEAWSRGQRRARRQGQGAS
jgi:DNA-binding FadR family transcriptional regulator